MAVPTIARVLSAMLCVILLGLMVFIVYVGTGELKERRRIKISPSPVERYQEPSNNIEKNTCLPPQ